VPARPVRFGVVGCGVIAYWTHLRELRRMKGATLVAAADPDPEARRRAHRLSGVPVHERAEDLVARPDVDAVLVGAPPALHADLAVAVASAGKHLYLEKPIATTAGGRAPGGGGGRDGRCRRRHRLQPPLPPGV